MERDLLLAALVAEVLGPRGGPDEVLGQPEDPREEYIAGVLAPHTAASVEPDADAALPGEDASGAEDQQDAGDNVQPQAGVEVDHLVCPALDPRARPASLGLSFAVSCESGDPSIDICCTWARYAPEPPGGWRRRPAGDLWENVPAGGVASRTAVQDPGIEIQIRSQPRGTHWRVSVFLVNVTPVADGAVRTEDHVFQPQIRIHCREGTRLVSLDEGRSATTDEERTLAMLYSNRPSYARGHLCAATWAALDAERAHLTLPPLGVAPYCWADGAALFDPTVLSRFSLADVRTEYVPVLPVNAPDKGLHPQRPAPELNPDVLGELWDPAALRAALSPLTDAYADWVALRDGEVGGLAPEHRGVGRQAVTECETALRRMRAGIDLLVADADARLAFCFANRAIALQSLWIKHRVNPWFPFQLGFQLLNLPAIVNRAHADRDVCDLLWFPTGGGKTEAYLGLAAFTMAYRRLRARRAGDRLEGAGVAILSRYTLRLLTIQQFRRALALVTACEFLRTRTTPGGSAGWRPKACGDATDQLWGDTRFSAGLWVGGGVTPNNLHGFEYRNRRNQMVTVHGAIDILEDRGQGEGEPAQVLTCPACETVLAIPPEGFQSGESATLQFVVGDTHLPSAPPPAAAFSDGPFQVSACTITPHPDRRFCTVSLVFTVSAHVVPPAVDAWWRNRVRGVLGPDAWLVAARPSRPGYFIRTVTWGASEKPIDFEIYCPCPACDLNTGTAWREATAAGPWPAVPAFLAPDGTSTHCPIPAWTVDDQVYQRCPTMVIATVDKFARLSFEPRAASLFGNVDHCNEHLGYYRTGCPPDGPSTRPAAPRPHVRRGRNVPSARFTPPDLVLQDELHLIEGPLGSMVGIFEAAVDLLASATSDAGRVRPKYIASTATVRQAAEQVQSLFVRELAVFPPSGLSAEDSFFARSGTAHPRDAGTPGRLYAGIAAPGRGAQTPLRNIWARLLQHVADRLAVGAARADLDPFWTLVGYFNAIRELSGAVALARQDIPQRLGDLSLTPRQLSEGEPLELSSRADSLALPGMLDRLRVPLTGRTEPVNAVVATSMFGTGVDVDRLGLMVVQGQPKTSSSYIQATGRVGRSRGGVVVTFFRASRPRDLNHYEFFTTYHAALYRHVEPVTVNPFSPRARDRALGPVAVAILRQADRLVRGTASAPVHERWRVEQRLTQGNWHCRASEMAGARSDPEVAALPSAMEERAQLQPPGRRPGTGVTDADAAAELDCWQQLAARAGGALVYHESTLVNPPQRPVVLGDLAHLVAGTGLAYEDAPTSLREVEATTTFRGWPGRAHQEIRPSQFVITYGPGTILETRSGPVVMKSMDEMFRLIGRDPQDFEIVDPRLSRRELNGARIARLPTNDELQVPIDEIVYPTEAFPFWALCTRHNPQILYQAQRGCPLCPAMNPPAIREKAGREAIRFVLACEAGHLDEIDWHRVVHGPGGTCQPDHYRWHGGGRALRFVELECPRCNAPRANMGQAYGHHWPCRCRLPERGAAPPRVRCTRSGGNSGRVMQRGAANLRMNVPVAALTIIDLPGRLHNVLADQRILSVANLLQSMNMLDQANFQRSLGTITPPLPATTLALLTAAQWAVLHQALVQLLQWGAGGAGGSLLEEEFQRLERAATHGAPPVPSAQPGGPPLFEVRRADVRTVAGPTGRVQFRVTPVSRLRMVFVQKGYQRMDPQGGEEVSTSFTWSGQTWYPGVALYGEGIFLDLDGQPLPLSGTRVGVWQDRHDQASATEPRLHPVHVWWHTLAHRLLQSLAVDSGYSSAAIRERVYLHADATGVRGGLLLYTVQPGGDGTLGGLISLVPRFGRVLDAALRDLTTCSNDPLCEQAPRLGADGAACYSCLLASETSCEHRNLGLDRLLLLDNLP
ncbi:MAG TPA: DISARM system helicase DrmA [Streptosporangiaceae bacterium]|nr:DISARM system helicase DrmA [Streptosporangiaceae bacterium]